MIQIYTCVCVCSVRACAQIIATTLQLNDAVSTSDSYSGFQNTECPFYRFPEQGSLVAQEACMQWDLPRQLPTSGTR
jgi:hypothetical protein